MKEIYYEELAHGYGFPKMEDSIMQAPYPFQKEISSFLKNGTIVLTRLSRERDVFTNMIIPDEVHVMSSDEYVWSSVLAWYVEKHNLRLPKDFEEYILGKLGIH